MIVTFDTLRGNDCACADTLKIRASDNSGIRIYKGDENNLQLLYKQTEKKYPRDLNFLKSLYNYYKNRNMVDLYFALLDTRRYLIR